MTARRGPGPRFDVHPRRRAQEPDTACSAHRKKLRAPRPRGRRWSRPVGTPAGGVSPARARLMSSSTFARDLGESIVELSKCDTPVRALRPRREPGGVQNTRRYQRGNRTPHALRVRCRGPAHASCWDESWTAVVAHARRASTRRSAFEWRNAYAGARHTGTRATGRRRTKRTHGGRGRMAPPVENSDRDSAVVRRCSVRARRAAS